MPCRSFSRSRITSRSRCRTAIRISTPNRCKGLIDTVEKLVAEQAAKPAGGLSFCAHRYGDRACVASSSPAWVRSRRSATPQPATWAALREGRSAIGPITSLPRDALRFGIAAEVRDFDPLKHFDEKRLILLDRVSQFALVAAREAIAQSGIDFARDNLGENTAVVIGTGIGGENTNDEASRRMYGENNPRLHPLTIVRLMANAPACHDQHRARHCTDRRSRRSARAPRRTTRSRRHSTWCAAASRTQP